MSSQQQKTKPKPKPAKIFTQETIAPPKRGAWKIMLPLSIALCAIAYAAWYYGWHAKAVTLGSCCLQRFRMY